MFRSVREKIYIYFNKGHERSILTKKNIAVSFGIKGITILISLIMIPLTINYVNSERNGIWVTLYSMITWINLFDLGFGNGLKNKLAEAKAKGETALARKYVSSTYAIMTIICLVIFILFFLINPHLDWSKILRSASTIYSAEIQGLVVVCILSLGCLFVLNLLKYIVIADQRPAIGSFLDMLGQLLTLAGIFILSKTRPPSLVSLGVVTGFSSVIVYTIAGIILFNGKYKAWRPSWKFVDFHLAQNMMNLGIKFFIATCAAFVISQTLPFLILYMTNPVEVTKYNTSFRMFSVAFNIIGIIILPYWSSFTDAYTLNDFQWMKKSIAQLHKFFIYLVLFQALVLCLSPVIYYLWINVWMKNHTNTLNIPFVMSFAVSLYVCVMCWLNIHIYPLNGTGKVKLQLYSSIFEMVSLIPLSIWMGRTFGALGIILTPVIIYIPRMIWAPIQLNKLVNNRATGIWNK
jgi:O-antigen/teichoic acid export membrane protein